MECQKIYQEKAERWLQDDFKEAFEQISGRMASEATEQNQSKQELRKALVRNCRQNRQQILNRMSEVEEATSSQEDSPKLLLLRDSYSTQDWSQSSITNMFILDQKKMNSFFNA